MEKLLNEIYYYINFFTNPVPIRLKQSYYDKGQWPTYDFESPLPENLPYLEIKAPKKSSLIKKLYSHIIREYS